MLSGCEHLTALNHAFASVHVSQRCGLKKVQIRMKRWHSKKHIASENFLDVRVLFSRFRNDESNRTNLRSGTGNEGGSHAVRALYAGIPVGSLARANYPTRVEAEFGGKRRKFYMIPQLDWDRVRKGPIRNQAGLPRSPKDKVLEPRGTKHKRKDII